MKIPKRPGFAKMRRDLGGTFSTNNAKDWHIWSFFQFLVSQANWADTDQAREGEVRLSLLQLATFTDRSIIQVRRNLKTLKDHDLIEITSVGCRGKPNAILVKKSDTYFDTKSDTKSDTYKDLDIFDEIAMSDTMNDTKSDTYFDTTKRRKEKKKGKEERIQERVGKPTTPQIDELAWYKDEWNNHAKHTMAHVEVLNAKRLKSIRAMISDSQKSGKDPRELWTRAVTNLSIDEFHNGYKTGRATTFDRAVTIAAELAELQQQKPRYPVLGE